MATANEVLEQMEQHPELYVSADVCIVDPVTRTISVPDAYRILGVESDESVKVVPFQCPKMVEDDVDLTDFTLYINYVNAGGDFDMYSIENVKESGENITFDWIIRRSVTARRGTIRFILCAKRSDDEGNIIQEWNTTINDECESLEGLEGAPSIADQFPDIIQQILEKLQEIIDGGGGTGGPVDQEQIQQAVNDYLTKNPPSGMTTEQQQQLQQNTTDITELKSAFDKFKLKAYDAGVVKPITRNDYVYDNIVPTENSKYINSQPTYQIVSDDSNLIHEPVVLIPGNSYIAVMIYFENMTGENTDYAVQNQDTRIRGRYIVHPYEVANYPITHKQFRLGSAFDILYPNIEMSDGSIAEGGWGTETAWVNNNRLYVMAYGYVSGAKKYVVTYADFPSERITEIPGNIRWSKPQEMTLKYESNEYSYNQKSVAQACGIENATIQSNNQVWNDNGVFYMAVNIRFEGAAVFTSQDGITWDFKMLAKTAYKCDFVNECACAVRSNRLWIAARNNNTSSTTTFDKNDHNYLTLLKINTSTWQKIDEYNIPDCGCKPFFIPPSTAAINKLKVLLLMHNPYIRESAKILAIGDYPLFYLGEIISGSNYITAYGSLSSGQLANILICGTYGLATDKKGILLRSNINIYQKIAVLDNAIEAFKIGVGNTWYTITNNLTNANNSNPVTKIKYGAQYSAILIPQSDDTIKNVEVIMNDEDITSKVYSDGVINIGFVSGNITITCK